MPPILIRLQLGGEIFLLTFPLIEPAGDSGAHSQRAHRRQRRDDENSCWEHKSGGGACGGKVLGLGLARLVRNQNVRDCRSMWARLFANTGYLLFGIALQVLFFISLGSIVHWICHRIW
jgi:hypothetical protein